MQDIIGKCIELCPDKKKRQTSVDRKTTPPSSVITSICSASTSAESLSILNNNNAIVGADISKEAPPCVEVTKTGKKTRKRKPAFEVAETDEPSSKKTKSDFFSSTSFNGFSIKSHPGILPRPTDKTPIDHQLHDWVAIDKDTKMAAFEKTWINDKSTTAVFVIRMLRRYKRKETGEGAVYTLIFRWKIYLS